MSEKLSVSSSEISGEAPRFALEVGTASLAALLDISPRRVRQLAVAGILERLANGNFDVTASVAAFIANRVKVIETRFKRDPALQSERLRNLRFQNEVAEEGLVSTRSAMAVISAITATIEEGLRKLPDAFADDLAMQRKINDCLDEVLVDLQVRADIQLAALRQGCIDDGDNETMEEI